MAVLEISQGVQLREQCVRDPRGTMFDLVEPSPEGSGAPEVPQLAHILAEQWHGFFVVGVAPVLALGDDMEVGNSSDNVVRLFLDAAGENFGADFRLLLLGLVDHMVDLGGVLCRAVVVVFGVFLRCPEQRENGDVLSSRDVRLVITWVVDGSLPIFTRCFQQAAERWAELGDVGVGL
eukprot:scaffold15425_cov62-Attheya_sp.AAC.3